MKKTGLEGGVKERGRCPVVWCAVFSVLLSLVVIVPSLLLLVDISYWEKMKNILQEWLESNHWDLKVSCCFND